MANLIANLVGGSDNKPKAARDTPIVIVCKSAKTPNPIVFKKVNQKLPTPVEIAETASGLLTDGTSVNNFESYSFERNMLAPAAPFRFTAPGLDKATRLSIRSGDTIQLLIKNPQGAQIPVATGFIDEVDTHIMPSRLEYVITGRDTLGQLVDNSAVDQHNTITNLGDMKTGKANPSLVSIGKLLISNTRIPQQLVTQQLDNGGFLFQTNPGETKMNVLQRYLELANALVWTLPNGQVVIGKPSFFSSSASGNPILTVGTSADLSFVQGGNSQNQASNVLDCRVKRNWNNAIRQIVVQMQNGAQWNAGQFTINNNDSDLLQVVGSGVGRSVYNISSFGTGAAGVNFFLKVANTPSPTNNLGAAIGYRQIARENVQILEVELAVQGHFDSQGNLYNVDKVYYVNIPDENISQNMYCYSITMELTLDHGMITKLRLCKLGTIVAGSYQFPIAGGSSS